MAIGFIIFKILMIIMCILLFVLVLILFIPFQYSFIGRINNNVEGLIEIKWIFGLTKFTVSKDEKNPKLKIKILKLNIYNREIIKKNYQKKEKKSKSRFNSRNFGKELLIELLKFIKDIFNLVKPQYLKVIGVYGFEDPSLTGILLGLISTIEESFPKAEINLEPAFNERIINIEAQVGGEIKLYLLCYRILKLFMEKEVRQNLFKKSKTAETF